MNKYYIRTTQQLSIHSMYAYHSWLPSGDLMNHAVLEVMHRSKKKKLLPKFEMSNFIVLLSHHCNTFCPFGRVHSSTHILQNLCSQPLRFTLQPTTTLAVQVLHQRIGQLVQVDGRHPVE